MRVIIVAGTCSGVGKSSIALGLMAAYTRRGLRVQPFKIGAGFLDPMHHKAATGQDSFNLDTWLMSRELNLAFFSRCASDADVAIVEGVMGLFDGLDGKSELGSTAEMAKLLSAPVLLVVDSTGLARSAAALVRGYTTFDPDVKFAGIIFNKVEVPAHKCWLIDAVSAAEENIKVLGGIPITPNLELAEQHLHSSHDERAPAGYLRKLCDMVEHNIDLDGLLDTAGLCKSKSHSWEDLRSYVSSFPYPKQVRIGVARDAVFCLYYQANLTLLQEAGAELVYFSPLRDVLPTRLDAVILGDGYPEQHLEELSSNKQMLYGLRAFADAGGIIYGEGCGLVYLSQAVENQKHELFPMVAVFSFSTIVGQPASKLARYVKVVPQENCVLFPPEVGEVRGQVQDATVISWQKNSEGMGVCPKGLLLKYEGAENMEELEGYMQANTMASSVRLHFGSNPGVVRALIERCRLDSTKAAAVAAASASAVASAGPVAAAAAGLAAARAVAAALAEPREPVCEVLAESEFWHSRSLSSSPVHNTKRGLTRSKSASWDGTSFENEDCSSFARKRTMSMALCSEEARELGTSFRDGHRQRNVPQKIVSLLPLATEIIVKLGAGSRLLGLTDMCDKPFGVRMGRHIVCQSQQSSSKESIFKLDVPWISRVKPDLVITQEVCSKCSIDSRTVAEAIVRADGRTSTMLVLNPYTLSDVWASIIELGDMLGLYKEACQLVNTLRSRLRKVANAVSSRRRWSVLLLQNLDPLVLGGRWIAEMEMLSGALDGLQKPGCNSEELRWQRVTSYAPEVVILAPCSSTAEETLTEVYKLARQPGFWSLPAVESRQVYICDGSFFSRHGLKLVEGVELLARILHPAETGKASGILKMCLKSGRKSRAEDLHKHFKAL